MTAKPQIPSLHQPLVAELEEIGRRLESGGITPEEAEALGDDVMVRMRQQAVVDADAQVRLMLKKRRIKAILGLAAIFTAIALVLLLR